MPVDLQNLFQSDPAAQELGLGFLGQERQMNDAKLAQQLFETQKGKAMLPLEMASKEAGTAQTKSLTAGQDIENQFNQGNMRTRLMQNYQNLRKSMSDNDLKEIENASQAYTQIAPMLEQMPGLASHAAARKLLGNYYDPSFDQIPPQHLGKVIGHIGVSMQQMKQFDPEYSLKRDLADVKATTERYKAEIAAQAKRDVANTVARSTVQKLDNELKIVQEKAKLGSYQQQSGYYTDLAQQAATAAGGTEDEQMKQLLLSRAKVFSQIAEDAKNQEIQKAVAAAIEANRRAIDPAGLGKGEIRPVTPPGKPGQGTKENPIKLD